MTQSVDLNADMGEGFGPWCMGDDAALLDIVTSANIACGMHAGDWETMATTMRAAARRGVGIGAHPGFPDLQGFGRRRMTMDSGSLRNLIAYQVGAAQGIARFVGAELRHVKLHGALANIASEDKEVAWSCYEAALAAMPGAGIMVLAGSAQQAAAEEIGAVAIHEVFADRTYNDDATLVDRKQPAALIHDPDIASSRMVEMLQQGAIITESGKVIPTRIDTICVHGDTPAAVALAARIRDALLTHAIEPRRFRCVLTTVE
ncbi:5-oxoprolinase subunit PxpA [Defluviimonas aestuarii]|uniref:LamB/YcsF family protein n=1 Tax=Albidovulum aestuarii TaxID=1130726 RepID=UPI00249A67B5|nr:5-oxoprolinase subunit PxpA [Defluviimonas aestuarii]MDI3335693.1 5-oxoprolinase subunit PxpA [Defluviimonas aestuarii]